MTCLIGRGSDVQSGDISPLMRVVFDLECSKNWKDRSLLLTMNLGQLVHKAVTEGIPDEEIEKALHDKHDVKKALMSTISERNEQSSHFFAWYLPYD